MLTFWPDCKISHSDDYSFYKARDGIEAMHLAFNLWMCGLIYNNINLEWEELMIGAMADWHYIRINVIQSTFQCKSLRDYISKMAGLSFKGFN